jgi:RHS repeat-associated protein
MPTTPKQNVNQDYYSFGMLMPGRTYTTSGNGYRYGFNGKENDNEVKGQANQQDYGMRIYDGRLGKFLSVDPLCASFASLSAYHFSGNMPIWAKDLDGLEAWIATNKAVDVMSLSDYQEFSNSLLKKVASGEFDDLKFDCADLALFLEAKYFEQKKVEFKVTINNGSGNSLSFCSSDTKYTSFNQFFEETRGSVCAQEIAKEGYEISKSDVGVGDYYALNYGDISSTYHITLAYPNAHAQDPQDESKPVGTIKASGHYYGMNDPRTFVEEYRMDRHDSYPGPVKRFNFLKSLPLSKEEVIDLPQMIITKIDVDAPCSDLKN